jgi:hypothetical protein
MVPLLATGLLAVAVSGEATCPAAPAVEARVRALLPADGGGAGEARLERRDGRLRIALVRPGGVLAGERVIEGEHRCDELVDAAAVVVASWLSDERAAAGAPVLSVVDGSLELGAGLGAAVAGGMAPSGLLTAAWGEGVLAGRLAAILTGAHQAGLPAGTVRWRRWSLAAGPELRFVVGRASLQPHLAYTAAWLTADGRGFARTEQHASLVSGAEAGLRLALRARWRPFLEVSGAYWPGRTAVYQEPDQAETVLPRLEAFVTLGVSFAR